MRLEGRRILVVGASSGMGRETGLAAAAEGARVAFAARRLERVQEAAKQAGDGCIGLECDVTHDESCDAVVAAAVEALGGLDALVYAAGTCVFKALSDTDGSDWRQVLDTNLVGATLIMRAAAPPSARKRSTVNGRASSMTRRCGI